MTDKKTVEKNNVEKNDAISTNDKKVESVQKPVKAKETVTVAKVVKNNLKIPFLYNIGLSNSHVDSHFRNMQHHVRCAVQNAFYIYIFLIFTLSQLSRHSLAINFSSQDVSTFPLPSFPMDSVPIFDLPFHHHHRFHHETNMCQIFSESYP